MSGIGKNLDKNQRNNDIPPTFYDDAGENLVLDLTKLIELVIQRYSLLKKIEELVQKKVKIDEFIKTGLPSTLNWDKEENIKNDISSYFILALIMCKNESDAKWLTRLECRLYKARLKLKSYNMYKILSNLGIELSEYDKSHKSDDLMNRIKFRLINNPNNKTDENIYFCKFEDALNLVPTHEFYLHKGNIYIPESDLPSLFKLVFEQRMEKTLNKIRIKSDRIKEDRRIKEIMMMFERAKDTLMKEEAEKMDKNMPNDEKLRTMNDVDMLSEKCFPLCMSLIERHINQYSHLMHFGRLQYTLFLKGAGLPVDECSKFFQKKYEKKTPADKFEKEYAYNIRHSYGLEGKRVSYTPYTCEKIINMNVPMGRECHGCPFKTYSEENLRASSTGNPAPFKNNVYCNLPKCVK